MPRRTPPPPVTDELLCQAWLRVTHPSWPATLKAALEHPLYRICLYGIARNLNRHGLGHARVRRAPQALPPMPLFDQTADAP